MDGDWKLRSETPPPVNKTRRLVLFGLLGLLFICGIGGTAYGLVARMKAARKPPAPAHDPSKPQGLKLFDGKVTFALKPIQTVDLRLPCSGLLTINLTFPEGTTLCAFLVPPEEVEKIKARQTFKHVEGFDVKTSAGTCQQAAQVSSGRYCLVLLDDSVSRSVVQVRAQLTGLE